MFSEGAAQVVGAAIELVAVAAAVRSLPARRVAGALVGGASAQLLLRLGDGPFTGSSALVVLAVAAPVLWSAWTVAHSGTRTVVRRTASVGGALVGLVSLAAAFSLVQARSSANHAIAHVRAGLDAARQGDSQHAGQELAAAANSFAAAHDEASSWWARPAQLIPLVGQQVRSIDRLTNAGVTASAAAAKATTEADVNALRLQSGHVDIAKIEAAAKPLAEVRAALADVQRAIDASRSPWLTRPLATRLDAVSAEMDRAASDADLAARAIDCRQPGREPSTRVGAHRDRGAAYSGEAAASELDRLTKSRGDERLPTNPLE